MPPQAKSQTQSLECCHIVLALQGLGMNRWKIHPYHFPALESVPPASTGGRSAGIFGHGFLIASDNLTKHPFGPGTQPEMMSMTPVFR